MIDSTVEFIFNLEHVFRSFQVKPSFFFGIVEISLSVDLLESID